MKTLQIDPYDNVLIALRDLSEGETVQHQGKQVVLPENVPAKHKFLLEAAAAGAEVRMYGTVVGRCTTALHVGQRLTTDRLENATAAYGPWTKAPQWTAPNVSRWQSRTFRGYHRADGRVGTANHWLVIPLVFCENRNVERLRELLAEPLGYGSRPTTPPDLLNLINLAAAGQTRHLRTAPLDLDRENSGTSRRFPNVDGIKFITHEAGCGGTRQDAATLCRLLAAYVDHPNVAGATVLSLGCQNAEIELFRKALRTNKPIYILDEQTTGTGYLEEAVRCTLLGMAAANQLVRRPAPLSKLVLGLECGGSDGFSGISANPVLGHVSDLVVALGGTAILAEFPELAGVEQELINRCRTRADAESFVQLIRKYEDAAVQVGSGFKDNPSPGNIRDGLITDAMKSAGPAPLPR